MLACLNTVCCATIFPFNNNQSNVINPFYDDVLYCITILLKDLREKELCFAFFESWMTLFESRERGERELKV